VDSQLKNIEKIISIGIDIFSSPTSNFYRSQDETKEGYITYLSSKDAIREIVIDTSETSPTFSTNPPRDTFESFKKEAEFRAYMIGNQSNSEAWKNLIGRDLEPLEINQTEQLLINTISNGYGSFVSRPKGQGNLVVGVLKGISFSFSFLFFFQIKREKKNRRSKYKRMDSYYRRCN